MVDESDYFRGYARDIGLNPAIAGATNVQDALTAGGGNATLGNFTTDVVSQDTPTACTANGASHPVTCLIAAPPAWMDNAGHIIAAGLYSVHVIVVGTAGPTTPGKFITANSPFTDQWLMPVDGIGATNAEACSDVQALAAGDVPYLVRSNIVMPTDVTAAVTASLTVARLAS